MYARRVVQLWSLMLTRRACESGAQGRIQDKSRVECILVQRMDTKIRLSESERMICRDMPVVKTSQRAHSLKITRHRGLQTGRNYLAAAKAGV